MKEAIPLSLNRDEVQIEVIDLEPFVNEKYSGLIIHWSGSIGFGAYTIYKKAGEETWHADSEMMDTNEDHWFFDLLMKKLFDSVLVVD